MIVIFVTSEMRRRDIEDNAEHPVVLTREDFRNWDTDTFENYAVSWARFWPADIVMLVEKGDA